MRGKSLDLSMEIQLCPMSAIKTRPHDGDVTSALDVVRASRRDASAWCRSPSF